MLESKLLAVRHKHVTVCSATSIVAAIGAVVLGLAVGMLLDWWLDLPLWVRAIFLLIDLGALVFIIVNFMVWPILFGPDEEGIALQVEDAEPSLATRLIATVQLSRPGAVEQGWSASLVKAMIAQTEAMAQTIDFGAVVATDRLIKLTIGAALALLLAMLGFAWGYGNNVSTDLLRRAFLSGVEVPRKTHIDMGKNPDQVIARGYTVRLSAKASGIIPERGEVGISFDAGREQYFSIERDQRDTNAARFVRDIENVQGSFEYRVHLGDARSPWHNVKVLTRPLATNLAVIQDYPAYTHLKPEARALGDLAILSGSHLRLKVTCNNPCNATSANQGRPSKVYVAGAQLDVPMAVDAHDPHVLSADVPVPDEATGFTIRLVDANGLASAADAATYRIDVVQHKDPVVHITYPVEREELATAAARALIGVEVHDDYGIAKLSLMYKVDDGPVQKIDLDIKSEQQNLHNRYDWRLSKVAPGSTTQPTLEGSNIEYWLEALNNNNISKKGPGIGDSEHYALRIVSEEVKRAEIAGRMAAQIDAIKNGVDDQQTLSDTLGDLVLEKKNRP